MKMKYSLIAIGVLFIIGLSVSSTYAKIDPETAVGIWLFEEKKGNEVEDSSGKGHNGMIQGPTKWVEGKFGEALEFAGGNSVSIPDDDAFNFGEKKSFTVVFWFSFENPQDWNRLVRERNPSPWGSGNAGWEIQTHQVDIHVTLDDAKKVNKRIDYPGAGDGQGIAPAQRRNFGSLTSISMSILPYPSKGDSAVFWTAEAWALNLMTFTSPISPFSATNRLTPAKYGLLVMFWRKSLTRKLEKVTPSTL